MKVKRITGGPLPTNCYLLTDEKTGETAVIDPGFWNEELKRAVQAAGKISQILLTHGHYDHLGGALCVREATGAKIFILEPEKEFPLDPELNLASMLSMAPYQPFQADRLLADKETFSLGGLTIKTLHTPGHTVGSCCFLAEDALFSGDTLFCGSMGRTDFPTGSESQMMASLRMLAGLPGDYRVYPGHEEETTLEHERKTNPFLGGWV